MSTYFRFLYKRLLYKTPLYSCGRAAFHYTQYYFQVFVYNTCLNKSVENADVAFVKEADERTKLLEKNKQSVVYDEQVRANKAKD